MQLRRARRHPAHPRPVAPQQHLAAVDATGDLDRPAATAGSRPSTEDRDGPGGPASAQHGYKSMEELVRWRLYKRTGGGLMAELGSHQLDACSIFLGKAAAARGHGVGGKYFYKDDREVEDHVFCTFEFPGKNYDRNKGHGRSEQRHRRRHLLVDQHQQLRAVRRVRHGLHAGRWSSKKSKRPCCTARPGRPRRGTGVTVTTTAGPTGARRLRVHRPE